MNRLWTLLKKNWFLCGIACAVVLALLVPAVGVVLNRGGALSTAAVVAIFVLSGLALPSEEMRRGLRNVRVHAFCQLFIFGAVPAYFALTSGWLLGETGAPLLWGIYALAVFPTTISSCIVLTQMARGSVATTIFNAVLANLLGVLVSPLLLTLLLRRAGHALPAEDVARIFLGLVAKVLVPFLAGQVLRLRLRAFAAAHRGRLSAAAGVLVLVVVFLAFCRAAGSDALRGAAPRLVWPMAYLAGSNVVLMAAAYAAARGLRFAPGDVTAAVFVAPQKTLAMGVPLLSTYFAAQPEVLGIAMIPLLFYHPWQLLTAGVAKGFLTLPEPAP